jgi:hypothetical protein
MWVLQTGCSGIAADRDLWDPVLSVSAGYGGPPFQLHYLDGTFVEGDLYSDKVTIAGFTVCFATLIGMINSDAKLLGKPSELWFCNIVHFFSVTEQCSICRRFIGIVLPFHLEIWYLPAACIARQTKEVDESDVLVETLFFWG